jgi:hypothetical protein
MAETLVVEEETPEKGEFWVLLMLFRMQLAPLSKLLLIAGLWRKLGNSWTKW